MEYIHYWSYNEIAPEDKISKVIDEITKLIAICNIKLNMNINEKEILINGDKENNEDNQDFLLNFKEVSKSFCNTAKKPYDFVVCLVLLSCANNFDNFEFNSNAGILEWYKPIVLYEDIIGKLKLNREKHIIKYRYKMF